MIDRNQYVNDTETNLYLTDTLLITKSRSKMWLEELHSLKTGSSIRFLLNIDLLTIRFRTWTMLIPKQIQANLILCGLFICKFAYMRLKNCLFSGTYPLIDSDCRSLYMQIHYIRAYFGSPYLSHIMRSTCTYLIPIPRLNMWLKLRSFVIPISRLPLPRNCEEQLFVKKRSLKNEIKLANRRLLYPTSGM